MANCERCRDESRELTMRTVVLRIVALVSVLTLVSGLALPMSARAARDSRGMIERIDVFLADAATLNRAGDVEAAKTSAQKACFEVFENPEGPIRVNLSAKKTLALDSEFAEIRRMIIRGVALLGPDALATVEHVADEDGHPTTRRSDPGSRPYGLWTRAINENSYHSQRLRAIRPAKS